MPKVIGTPNQWFSRGILADSHAPQRPSAAFLRELAANSLSWEPWQPTNSLQSKLSWIKENPSQGCSRLFSSFEFWEHFYQPTIKEILYVFFPPKEKNPLKNNPPQRSGHWLGTIHSVELAGREGLKTACVLRACQFCDSWHGRGWVGRETLSQPNVSCLHNLILSPLLKECALWKHTQSLPHLVTFAHLQMFMFANTWHAF